MLVILDMENSFKKNDKMGNEKSYWEHVVNRVASHLMRPTHKVICQSIGKILPRFTVTLTIEL